MPPATSPAAGVARSTPHGQDQAHPAKSQRFEEFLKSIGCPTRLSELGIGDELFSRYAEDALLVVHDKEGKLPGRPPMGKEDIVEVLTSAL